MSARECLTDPPPPPPPTRLRIFSGRREPPAKLSASSIYIVIISPIDSTYHVYNIWCKIMTIDFNLQTILKADEMPIWSIVSPTKPVPAVFQTNKKSSGSELVKISHFQGPCLAPLSSWYVTGDFHGAWKALLSFKLTYLLTATNPFHRDIQISTAMVSLCRYRSTYIYVCYLMLQSAVLKYEKLSVISHFRKVFGLFFMWACWLFKPPCPPRLPFPMSP